VTEPLISQSRTQYRYPLRALALAYAGSAIGLVLTLGLVWMAQLAASLLWLLTGAGALFLVYFVRTVCRQLTHVEMDGTGIRAKGPLGAAIRWENLCSLHLEYYSTRADREGGWMQLKLRDAQRTIRIDSDLDGFAQVVGRAAREAARLNLALDAATLSNLQALRS
jgi:hypothetical protein